MLSLPIITEAGSTLHVHRRGTDWVDYTPGQWDSALQGTGDPVCAEKGWMPRHIAKRTAGVVHGFAMRVLKARYACTR